MAPTRKTHHAPAAHLPVLKKGEACLTCKARKVKCDAVAPGCGACRRAAKFEGRDPDLVVCTYKAAKTPASSSAKVAKGKKVSRSSSPQEESYDHYHHSGEHAIEVQTTLPPSQAFSPFSSTASTSSTPFEFPATSTSTLPSTSTSTTLAFQPLDFASIASYPLFSNDAYFTESPGALHFDLPPLPTLPPMSSLTPLPLTYENVEQNYYDSSSAMYDSSPDSFSSCSSSPSWADESLVYSSPQSSSYDSFEEAPFTQSAHGGNETLSLPALFALPPIIGLADPGAAWSFSGGLFGGPDWGTEMVM